MGQNTLQNLEVTIKYAYDDLFEAQKMFYKASKAKKNSKIFGIFLICFSLLLTPFGFNFLNVAYIICGLLLLFAPRLLLKFYTHVLYQYLKFCGTTKITITQQGVKVVSKMSRSYKKWCVFKYLNNSEILLLYRPLPWLLYSFVILTPIPKKYLKEKDWENLLTLVKEKIELKDEVSKKKKFSFTVLVTAVILSLEGVFFLLYALITKGLGFDPKFDKSITFYIVFSMLLPAIAYSLMKGLNFSLKRLSLLLLGCIITSLIIFAIIGFYANKP